VFASRRKIIFVHGCFWHGHGCAKGKLPKSRLDYWVPKIEANRARDARAEELLQAHGWHVLTVWQCETRDAGVLKRRLEIFLDGATKE
jgi:DNA mismatch endonuclease (patch repair protein)